MPKVFTEEDFGEAPAAPGRFSEADFEPPPTLFDLANKPLPQFYNPNLSPAEVISQSGLEPETKQELFQSLTPEPTAREELGQLAFHPIEIPSLKGETTLGKIGAAGFNLAKSIPEFMLSPFGAATAGLGIAAPVLRPVIGAGFAGSMAGAAGEKFGQASVTGDLQDWLEAAGITLGGGYAAHAPLKFASNLSPLPEPTPFGRPAPMSLAPTTGPVPLGLNWPGSTAPLRVTWPAEQLARIEERQGAAAAEGNPLLRAEAPTGRPIPFQLGEGVPQWVEPSGLNMAREPVQLETPAGTIPLSPELKAMTPQAEALAELNRQLGEQESVRRQMEQGSPLLREPPTGPVSTGIPPLPERFIPGAGGLRMAQPEIQIAPGFEPPTVKITPELSERLPIAPAPERFPPSPLTPPYSSGFAAQALRERAAQAARVEDFPKALAEKVSQDVAPPGQKPLTPNQLRIVQDSLRKAIEENQMEGGKSIIPDNWVDWADQTINRSKSLGIQPVSGPELLAAYAVKGARLIETGIKNFAEWSKEMLTQFGDAVKPHLDALFKQSTDLHTKGQSYASQIRKEPVGGIPEHQGAAHGENIRPYAPEVRQEEGAGAVSGNRVNEGGAVPAQTVNKFITDFEAGERVSTHDALAAGMKVRTIADLDALANSRRTSQQRSKTAREEMEKARDAETDPAKKEQLLRAYLDKRTFNNPQLPREAIEAATNVGSHIEGKGSIPERLGPRPLDWAKNPEVAQWLKDNAESLNITLPDNFKVPELTVESVTPLEPQSGSPLSATDALINKLEALPPRRGIVANSKLEDWADRTIRRSKSLGIQPVSGPQVLAAYAVKGAALLEKGIVGTAEWVAEMIKEYGPKIRPYLNQVRQMSEGLRAGQYSQAGKAPTAGKPLTMVGAQPAPAPVPAPGGAAAPPVQPPVPPVAAPGAAPAAPTPPVSVGLNDVYKIFEPSQKPSPSLKERGVQAIEALRTGFSSKFRSIDKMAEDIAKASGVPTRTGIAAIMEQLKGSQGRGEADIYRFDRSVSDLVKGNEKDFNAYMFLQRSLDRLRSDLADIQKAQAGGNVRVLNRRSVANYTIPQLEQLLTELENKVGPETMAKLRQAGDNYQQQMDIALREQVSSGRMSTDVYNAIKAGNQFYAPFKVMKYFENEMRPPGTGARIDTAADYTKAMVGIEDPGFKLGDMLGAARQNLLISRILSDKNNAMRYIAELAPFDVNGRYIRKLAKNEETPHGWDHVTIFENGERNRYAVQPQVAQAVQSYGGTAGGFLSKVLSAFSVPFRAGATALNIPFQVANLLADQPRAAFVSKYGIRNPYDAARYILDFAKSVFSTVTGDVIGYHNKMFQDFLDSGAAGTTVQEHLTPNALKFVEPTLLSKGAKIGRNILYTLPRFSAAIEQSSKALGVQRAMRIHGVKSGAELKAKFPEAITEIRRFSGSPDFGRQGHWTEQARLNLLYMFLNARIQGAIADVGRLLGRDGTGTAARTWFRMASVVGVPTAYLYALNNSDEYRADYEKRPDQEKKNYWLIPKDSFITNEYGEKIRDYWRIPKRDIAKWISNLTESLLSFANKNDPQTFADFSKSMIQDISPVNIQGKNAKEVMESMLSSMNPIIKAPLEMASGRDFYRHKELIPTAMQKASPELQYTDRTPEAFIKLAEAMPDVAPEILRSPLVLEQLTRNLTAGLFTQFLPSKQIEGRSKLESIPLLQRFQVLPYTDQQKFNEQMDSLEREAADEQLTRHRAAMKLLEDNPGKSLPEVAQLIPRPLDPKLVHHVVDLWLAKKNGATAQDRQILALPVAQRAKYIADAVKGMTAEQKNQAILDFARKRILTRDVVAALPELLAK